MHRTQFHYSSGSGKLWGSGLRVDTLVAGWRCHNRYFWHPQDRPLGKSQEVTGEKILENASTPQTSLGEASSHTGPQREVVFVSMVKKSIFLLCFSLVDLSSGDRLCWSLQLLLCCYFCLPSNLLAVVWCIFQSLVRSVSSSRWTAPWLLRNDPLITL